MLQKFLFVGIGGSGGKTLRFLHELLTMRLEEAGWHRGIPAAWQFVHIDVPITPDGTSPDLPPQLPAGHYHGLAPDGLTYANLDALVQRKGAQVVEHTATWRPEPTLVGVPPAFGAGQYRAVGRTILGAALPNVVHALRQAASRLHAVDVDQELALLAGTLTGQTGVSPHAPQVIVVNSVAGGSGAGTFLDVCDVIRAVLPESGDQIASLLFTPQVFADIPPASRSGVNANALASIAELVNAYWSTETPTASQVAFLSAAGVAPHESTARGPSMTLLVGRSNGSVTFTSQIDVFRAAARALTAWTTDQSVQNGINASVIGNWVQSATRSIDRTGLAPGRPAPFSALGYASIGLGRNRFATYGQERLARHAVEVLLRGHLAQQGDTETPAAARDRIATDHLFSFLERAHLRELGKDHNQVIDAIRGGDENTRAQRMRSRRSTLVERSTGSLQQMTVPQAQTKTTTAVEELGRDVVSAENRDDGRRAATWVSDIQDHVLDATADLVGRAGLAVAIRVVELAADEIANEVVPELGSEAQAYRHVMETGKSRITSAFANFDGQLTTQHPGFAKAADEGLRTWSAACEAHLRELAAQLLTQLTKGLLTPLRSALARTQEALAQEEQGNDGNSVIARWSTGAPPKKLLPSENERLLEPPGDYPKQFVDLVRRTTGRPATDGAVRAAVHELIVGRAGADGPQTLIGRRSDWSPPLSELPALDSPSEGRFAVELDAEGLRRAAEAWIDRPQTAFGDYLHESLADHLDADVVNPAEHTRRLDAFEAELRQAISVARPLVEIDLGAYAHFHGPVGSADELHSMVISRLPFSAGHAVRARVRSVFPKKTDAELDAMFDDAAAQRIEITTFLSAPSQPVVFSSLTQPIAGDWATHQASPQAGGFWQWRRTRPLGDAVPAAPDVRGRMIRGWFVARMLGYVASGNPLAEPTTVRSGDGTRLAFPFPLLGPRIHQMDDILPAVLESLAVALVDRPKSSLQPYHRLAGLGAAMGSGVGSTLPDELDTWIAEGRMPSWADLPRAEMAGTPAGDRADRAGALVATLDTYVAYYTAIPAPWENGRTFLRSWEIRDEIVGQLTELREAIDAARHAVDFTVGVG